MNFLLVAQVVISVLIISAILMQSRGTGLGSAFGGGGQSYHTRRGAEKVLFRATIVLIVVFVFISLFALV